MPALHLPAEAKERTSKCPSKLPFPEPKPGYNLEAIAVDATLQHCDSVQRGAKSTSQYAGTTPDTNTTLGGNRVDFAMKTCKYYNKLTHAERKALEMY